MKTTTISFLLATIVATLAQPANDHRADRIPLTGFDIVTAGSNVDATVEPGETSQHSGNPGPSVWWEWTAPATSTVTIQTADSTFDTRLEVYLESPISGSANVAADDDSGPNLTSTVRFTAQENVTYLIKVDGYNGATGGIQLRLLMDTALKVQYAFDSRGLVQGKSLLLDVSVTGPGNITYQWSRDNVLLPLGNAPSYRILFADINDSGTYRVIARNEFGSTVAHSATITVRAPLEVGVIAPSTMGATNSSYQVSRSLDFIGYTPVAVTNFQQVPPSISVLPAVTETNAALSNLAAIVTGLVEEGGTLIVLGDGIRSSVPFLNMVLGLNMESRLVGGYSLRTSVANTTPFTNAPTSIPSYHFSEALAATNLPAGSQIIYETNGLATVAVIPHADGRVIWLAWDWWQAKPTYGLDGGWLDLLTAAIATGIANPPGDRAPRVVIEPRNNESIIGFPDELGVLAFGTPPLHYQWHHDGQPLANETNATLRFDRISQTNGGNYTVSITNQIGSTSSRTASLSILHPGPLEFQITSLQSTGYHVVDIVNTINDDEGGIAVTPNSVFVTGESGSAAFSRDNLTHARKLPARHGRICMDLRSGTAYVLGNYSGGQFSPSDQVNSLMKLDDLSGEYSGEVIPLSQTFALPDNTSHTVEYHEPVAIPRLRPLYVTQNHSRFLICSGFGRVVIYDSFNGTLLDIILPSGRVIERGFQPTVPFYRSETLASWGVAEFFDDSLYLTYRESGSSHIVRQRVGDSTNSVLAAFPDLGDMASWVIDPYSSRWYFTYEGSSTFGYQSEALGYASASTSILPGTNQPPFIAMQPKGSAIPEGHSVDLESIVLGSGPIAYQWHHNDARLIGATNSTLQLTNARPTATGSYRLTASNSFGVTTSVVAQVTVFDPGPLDFQVLNLSSYTGTDWTRVDTVVGDDDAGIAVSKDHVFLTGDLRTGRIPKEPLSTGISLPHRLPGIFSDLRSRQVYTLGRGTNAWEPGEIADTIIPIDPDSGTPRTTNAIRLSQPLELPNGSTVFAGYGRVLFHNGSANQVLDVLLPSGFVINRGYTRLINRHPSEGWAMYGVAEHEGDDLRLIYPSSYSDRIVRQRLGATTTSTVMDFYNYGEFAGIVVDPFSSRWYLHVEGYHQFTNNYTPGSLLSFPAEVNFSPPTDMPPLIRSHPTGRTVLRGEFVILEARALGTPPLSYQWLHDGSPVPGATNVSMVLTNLQPTNSGNYALLVTNAFGSAVTKTSVVSVLDITLPEFRINHLSSSGAKIQRFDNTVGDDRAGIAVTDDAVIVTGDSGTGKFPRNPLQEGFQISGTPIEGILSDLRSQVAYTLGVGSNIWQPNLTATTLIPLDPSTGQPLTNQIINLSDPIYLSYGASVFAGYGRVLFHEASTDEVFEVHLPGGQVIHRGRTVLNNEYRPEGWATYGVAEHFDGMTHLVYRESSSSRIVRQPLGGTESTTIATFSNLGDAAAITMDPYINRWYLTTESYSQFDSSTTDKIVALDADITVQLPTNSPPRILTSSGDTTRLSGESVTLSARVWGAEPFSYRWRMDGQAIPGATNATLAITNLTQADAGEYTLAVSNQFGGEVSASANLTVVDIIPSEFRILNLTTENSTTVNHYSETGIQSAGFALSPTHLFYTGSSSTARFPKDPLRSGVRMNTTMRALFTDLRTRTAYTFGAGTNVWNSNNSAANTIIPLDPGTGEPLLSGIIHLSEPLNLTTGDSVFSGFGRVVLHSGANNSVHEVILPQGLVIRRDPTPLPDEIRGRGWASYGVAEFFDGKLYLTYIAGSPDRVVRRSIGSATNEVVQYFSDLGGAASLLVDPYTARWYIQSDEYSQFGAGYTEHVTEADARVTFSYPTNLPPSLIANLADQSVMPGESATFRVAAFGTPPLHYRWHFNGQPIAGATNTSITVSNIQSADLGAYFVTVSNRLGATNSAVADLSMIEPGPLEFRILELGSTASRLTDVNSTAGDDRGGIAMTANGYLANGDSSTIQISGANGSVSRLSTVYDGLCSDLRSRTAYVLGNDGEAWRGNATHSGLNCLIRLDSQTGELTSEVVPLSVTFSLTSGSLICSGYGRVVIVNRQDGAVYDILLPSGHVTRRSPTTITDLTTSEGWGGAWGVAEYFDDALYVAYRGPSHRIMRRKIGAASSTVIQQFTNLGDISSIIVDPWSQSWCFRYESSSEFGSGSETFGCANALLSFASPSNTPPTVHLLSPTTHAFVGEAVELHSATSGTHPVYFQWWHNSNAIAGATNSDLVVSNVQLSDSGLYHVTATNAFGSTNSPVIRLEVTDPKELEFRVIALTTNNVSTVDTYSLSGDDDGGIALDKEIVIVNGDNSAALYRKDGLSNGTRVGRTFKALCSDLKTGTAYVLGSGGAAWYSQSSQITSLIRLDPVTGALTQDQITLSQPLNVWYRPMIFSGYGRIVVRGTSTTNLYEILLPTGKVTPLPNTSLSNAQTSESGGVWGVAEYFDDCVHLVYREKNTARILRHQVGSTATTVLARFSDLGDMANLIIDPSSSRWYFHYEGNAQFGNGSEILGSADAVMRVGTSTNMPPAIVQAPQNQTVAAGLATAFAAQVLGSSPLSYQWYFESMPIFGATNSHLILNSVTLTNSGTYTLAVSNHVGSTSASARLTVFDHAQTTNVAAVYLRSTNGHPWNTNGNVHAMNKVFGIGLWTDARYETVATNVLFSMTNQVIFMSASDLGEAPARTFINQHRDAIRQWVANGGHLFYNAGMRANTAPYPLGFADATVSFNVQSSGHVVPGHPFSYSPFQPLGSNWTGTFFAHGIVTGTNIHPVITASNTNHVIVGEIPHGRGRVLIGTLAAARFQNPTAHAANLRPNLLSYISQGSPGPAPVVHQMRRADSHIEVDVAYVGGRRMQIQASSNLVDWIDMMTPLVPASGTSTMSIIINTNLPAQFFRFRPE